MCVLRFFKNLVMPRNWLLLLYILLNIAIVLAIYLWGYGTEIEFNEELFLDIAYIVGGYLLVLIILATPIGEAFIRLTFKARKLARTEENARIFECFDDVYARALALTPKMSKKINLYMIDDDSINAFCIGSRTVVINSGLLILPNECIKGILAHEFGHIAHQDSLTTLALIISNWILYLAVCFVSFLAAFFFMFFDILLGIIFRWEDNPCYLSRAAKGIINIVYKIWLWIGILLNLATSRKHEYKADEYASKLDLSAELAVGLGFIDRDMSFEASILETIYSTHPKTANRVERLGYSPADIKILVKKYEQDGLVAD